MTRGKGKPRKGQRKGAKKQMAAATSLPSGANSPLSSIAGDTPLNTQWHMPHAAKPKPTAQQVRKRQMGPSWDSLAELREWSTWLTWLGLIVGPLFVLITVVISSGYGIWLHRINARIEELQNTASQTRDAQAPGREEEPQYSSRPTPEEIKAAIKDAPPLMRDDLRKQYAGTRISWDGVLTGGNKTFIFIESGDTLNSPTIRVPIKLPKHNFLLSAKNGTRLHVDGTIEEVESLWINIKDAAIRLKE